MSRRRRAPEGAHRPAAPYAARIAVVCTDLGRHGAYSLGTIGVVRKSESAGETNAIGLDARQPSIMLYPAGDGSWIPDDGRRRDEVDVIRRSRAGLDRHVLHRFHCRRCGRDVPIRDDNLRRVAVQLFTVGVSRLDISACRSILAK